MAGDAASGQFVAKGEKETAAFPGFGFSPDPAAVQLNDLLTMGQTDAGAFIFAAGMQPLEDDKDPVQELFFDANAIVLYKEFPMTIVPYGADIDGRRLIRFAKFDGVADQVLE